MDSVRAEYVYAGYAPLPSQGAARGSDRPGRGSNDHGGGGPGPAATRPQSTQRWREAQVRILTQLLSRPNNSCGAPAIPMTPSRTARMVRALEDIRVRDVVLHRLVVGGHHCDRCWEATIEVLCDALRSMPEGAGAPTATILALVAWMRGEGALATIAPGALSEDPEYRSDQWQGMMAQGTDPGSGVHPCRPERMPSAATRGAVEAGEGELLTGGPRTRDGAPLRSAVCGLRPGDRCRTGAPTSTRADTPTRPRLRRLPGTCTFCGRSRVPASSPGLLGGNPPTAVGCPR